jgi:hypothetical protein
METLLSRTQKAWMRLGMLRTNVDRLVRISVMGEVSSPVFGRSPYRISADGSPVVLPGVGGITYNVRVGDLATGWMADHVEPGVSIKNKEKEPRDAANTALNVLSCVGNEALVASGDAKGASGVVTGKHGGIEHVPAAIMGSGLGDSQTYSGDYDIQLFDEDVRKEYGLEDLKLGDLAAIQDADSSFGRIYNKGAITVGIVVHSDCVISGHGPGVTTLFTSSNGKIVPRIDENANIANLLKLRKDI